MESASYLSSWASHEILDRMESRPLTQLIVLKKHAVELSSAPSKVSIQLGSAPQHFLLNV